MEITFQTLGTNTYLNVELGANDELDSMSLGMLTNNDIPGLAAAAFTQMDTAKYIKYNVSAKVSAAQLFSGPVNKKRLIGVFTGIVNAMLSVEDYMIDPQTIMLDMDYIFADVTTCETVLVCLPIQNSAHKYPELSVFFKDIIFNTQFDQTENCDHVAQIINYLNSNASVSLTEFKDLLDRLSAKQPPVKSSPQKIQKPVAPAVQAQPIVPQAVVQPVQQPKPQVKNKFVDLQFGPNYPQGDNKNADMDKPESTQSIENTIDPDDEPISVFYLLQHYNKDNAAKYKAQQEAKKAKKTAGNSEKLQKVEKSSVSKNASTSFAIPGQQSDQRKLDFAIPGQPTPVVSQPVQPVKKVEQQVVTPTALSTDKCQNCGAAMSVKQVFCTSCGTRRAGVPTPQPVVTPVVQAGKPISFGETTVLGSQIGETTVLGAVANPNKVEPHLIRAKNNEKIPLNKSVFRIGKERSYVDYFIGDNTAISRSHANIVNHNGEFFVVDTNSTNHTYVNGGMIQSNVETKLSHGTKIRLANEDFEFRLY